MVKRKAKALESAGRLEEPRRSSRRISTAKEEPAPEKTSKPAPAPKKSNKTQTSNKGEDVKPGGKDEKGNTKDRKPSKSTRKSTDAPSKSASSNPPAPSSGRQYWLMKAEPESRLEKGHDIKFSIDDLAAKTEPEPWEGIRAYPGTKSPLFSYPWNLYVMTEHIARNNLRSMKKGDIAFFYHSSCKVPAIVGTMEIVQEHSPDSHDPSAPYHDPKSTPDDPKWSVVHVEFRQKLQTPITLKELKAWQGEKGHPLENMQMLKLARLSVSKVSAEEWDFLVKEMVKNGDVIKA